MVFRSLVNPPDWTTTCCDLCQICKRLFGRWAGLIGQLTDASGHTPPLDPEHTSIFFFFLAHELELGNGKQEVLPRHVHDDGCRSCASACWRRREFQTRSGPFFILLPCRNAARSAFAAARRDAGLRSFRYSTLRMDMLLVVKKARLNTALCTTHAYKNHHL